MTPMTRLTSARSNRLAPLAAGLLVGVLTALAGAAAPAFAATPVHKCMVNGSVTYQRDPCPTRGPRVEPTVERLNAEEKKRREAAPPARSGDSAKAAAPAAAPPALQSTGTAPAAAPPAPAFRCDGRTRCTQMTSCAEARYFLANCPGVKMDGNHDGIPCQEQWCGSR